MFREAIDGFEYFAFISYSSKDVQFAKKLQRDLERYHLPILLSQRYPRTPRRANPIFRDKTDLEQGNLTDMLMRGLRTSKFLIVICSEHSARPNSFGKRYVDMEVESFVALNPNVNKTRVIPIIYREKGGARATECLPPAVKALDLLALDVLDKGYAQTFNQLVSSMVGIKPGILWDRWGREARLRIMVLSSLVFLLGALNLFFLGAPILLGVIISAIAVTGIAFVAHQYFSPRTECYAAYFEQNNRPYGLIRLKREQVAHRLFHYRFTYKKNLLRKIECCNSAGVPTIGSCPGARTNRMSTLELAYDENGDIAKQVWKDEHGVILRELSFEKNKRHDWINFKTAGNDYFATHLCAINAYISSDKNVKSLISRYRVQRNGQGGITDIQYCNEAGLRCAEHNGVWGAKCEWDTEQGLLLSYCFTDRNGELMNDRFGVCGIRFEYDEAAQWVALTFINRTGDEVQGPLGYARMCFERDEWGNVVNKEFHREDGTLCRCLDAESPEIYGVAIIKTQYNEQGFIVEESYYNEAHAPILNRLGYAKVVYEPDDYGNVLVRSHYGVNQEPCIRKGESHCQVFTYDAYGHNCTISHFDSEKKPVCCSDGFFRKESRYDEDGRVRSIAHYDLSGEPTVTKKNVHKETYLYDELGNTNEVSYFGVDGNLGENNDGVARMVGRYDEHNNLIYGAFFGRDGNPCPCNKDTEVSSRTFEYGKNNHRTRECFFDIDGEPCHNTMGAEVERYTYSELGLRMSVSWEDSLGEPCMNRDKISRREYTYDEQGHCIEENTYGPSGEPYGGRVPYTKLKRSFNKDGLIERVRYYDSSVNPVIYKGIAGEYYEYDKKRRKVYELYLGADGQPVANPVGIAACRYTYDTQGNISRMQFFDVNNQPAVCKNGFACIAIEYDEKRKISKSFFDAKNQPCLCRAGYHREEYGYKDGVRFSTSYYGVSGEPVLSRRLGFWRQLVYRDARARTMLYRYEDTEGKPVVSAENGFAELRFTMDAANRFIRWEGFGVDGAPCIGRTGFAVRCAEYDNRGRLTGVTHRDAENKPCLAKGYAGHMFAEMFIRYLPGALGKIIPFMGFRDEHGQSSVFPHNAEMLPRSWSDVDKEKRRMLRDMA